MTERVAYCGLLCNTCPIHLATIQKNNEKQNKMRAEIVKLIKEQYGIDYKLEDISDCDGCRTEGTRLFSSSKSCPIRKCARENNLENCAYCPKYACDTLEAFFKKEPSAKARLGELNKVQILDRQN